MNDYLTTEELAAKCRTSPNTVRFWRAQGTGPQAFKLGRRVLYRSADVDAWINDHIETALRA